MTRFNCQNCGYTFECKGEKQPKKCPYCDSEGTVFREQNAEELVEALD